MKELMESQKTSIVFIDELPHAWWGAWLGGRFPWTAANILKPAPIARRDSVHRCHDAGGVTGKSVEKGSFRWSGGFQAVKVSSAE